MSDIPQDDHPRNRPALSISRGAAIAVLVLYVLWGLSVPIMYFSFLNLTIGGDPIQFPIILPIIVVVAPVLPLVFGFRWGSRWALRLFWVMTWLSIALVAVSLLIGLSLITGIVSARREQIIDAQFTFFVSLLLAAMGWWLQRKSRTVRWLDPSSRPSEWEPSVNRAHRR